MKKLILSVLLFVLGTTCFSQVNYTKKINTDRLEKLIVSKINEYRLKKGVDTLFMDDSLKSISDVECQYFVKHGLTNDPNFTYNVVNVFGGETFSSYHSNIGTKYNLDEFPNMDNFENYIVTGYINQYIQEKTDSTILVSKKDLNTKFVERVGITCILKGNTLFVSQVIYLVFRES